MVAIARSIGRERSMFIFQALGYCSCNTHLQLIMRTDRHDRSICESSRIVYHVYPVPQYAFDLSAW